MDKIEWFDNTSPQTPHIKKFAIRTSHDEYGFPRDEVYGYNDILKGDKVIYVGEEWTVVMVSRLGDFGLSKTGELPYTARVNPDKVVKVDA